MSSYQSWGRYPVVSQDVQKLSWRSEVSLSSNGKKLLPYGQGRSYGDVCLNAGGKLLSTKALDKIIFFDRENGLLSCEAGVTIENILKLIIPAGWFIPVSPGTKYVSIGGAVANDIHGKNHHCAGTFGCFVQRLQLLRSDGKIYECSESSEPELFKATIGGLGLTGLILSVEFRLKKICSPLISSDSIKFSSLDEFFEISKDSENSYDYNVAWLDCVSSGAQFGRGIFMRGNHDDVPMDITAYEAKRRSFKLSIPFNFPNFALNRFSMKCFNELYYQRQFSKVKQVKVDYDPFFYPLDAVKHWNRLYGSQGFLQFQCVLPSPASRKSLPELLKLVVDSGKASFLAVLKEFGDIKSPGMLSFPRPGVTLCLDFGYRGQKTIDLMRRLEDLVRSEGGALYPAKDACMTKESFQSFYPAWSQFKSYIDPQFSSSFWKRVTDC